MISIKHAVSFITQCSLLGALCLLFNTASAQYFNNAYDFDTSSDFGKQIIIQKNGSHLLFGDRFRYTPNSQYAGFSVTISPDGTQISNKILLLPDSNCSYGTGYYGKLSLTNTGQILLQVALNVTGSTKRQIGILKLNPNADLVFSKLYTDTLQSIDGIYDVGYSSRSGHYYVAGFTADTNNYFGSNNGMLLITDTNGNLISRKIYEKKAGIPVTLPNGVACLLESVEGLADGRILIGASNGNFEYRGPLGPNSKSYAHFRPWFILADSAGNIIRDTTYDYGFSGGGNIRTDRHGGYLHWGELDTLLTATASNFQNWPHYVAHLDSNFRMSGLYVFASLKSHTQLLKTMQLANGDYLALGRRVSNRPEPHGGFAARLSRSGVLKWEHTYLTSDTSVANYLADAAERPDGSIAMVGVSFRNKNMPAYRGQDCWLVSVDSNGCEIPGCNYTTAVPKEPRAQSHIKFYPNPTSGQLNVQSAIDGMLCFYNLQGIKAFCSKTESGTNTLSFPASLAAGVYMVVFSSTDGKQTDMVKVTYQP